ncbi:folate-dependent phosphoribosylglycinamide formyltransferase PurN [Actinokineospora baliensis]|uniref:hypothetical protein n=1 Tax=Actinokineospora baliensis TaxID=547056 RepID=UPI001EF88C87|nr:hypothetical protein [Actinokineospora baliensis]MBM7775991.1 folate-dependent phosphoribosylglycinamide formyltransferase PurN [Actinokineospora baliensis]
MAGDVLAVWLVVDDAGRRPVFASGAPPGVAVAVAVLWTVSVSWMRRLLAELTAGRIGLVVWAGYLTKIGPLTLASYADRIINIRPFSLLLARAWIRPTSSK